MQQKRSKKQYNWYWVGQKLRPVAQVAQHLPVSASTRPGDHVKIQFSLI